MRAGIGLRKIEVQQAVYELMLDTLVQVANSPGLVPLEIRQKASAAVKYANQLGPSYFERWVEPQVDADCDAYERAKDEGRTK